MVMQIGGQAFIEAAHQPAGVEILTHERGPDQSKARVLAAGLQHLREGRVAGPVEIEALRHVLGLVAALRIIETHELAAPAPPVEHGVAGPFIAQQRRRCERVAQRKFFRELRPAHGELLVHEQALGFLVG